MTAGSRGRSVQWRIAGAGAPAPGPRCALSIGHGKTVDRAATKACGRNTHAAPDP